MDGKMAGFKELLVAMVFFVSCALSADYTVDWFTVDGGGGKSTGAAYLVTGTIGQPDAGGPLTGGPYLVTGGFWSLISVVQTAGAPTLAIKRTGAGVSVSWPSPSTGFVLQQSSGMAPAAWSISSGISDDGTNRSLTVTSPAGTLFFRLMQP
jgi:hypothetical protein